MKLGQLLAIPIALFALKTFTKQISETKPTVVTPTPVPKVIVTPATPVPTPASVTNGFRIGPAAPVFTTEVFPEKLTGLPGSTGTALDFLLFDKPAKDIAFVKRQTKQTREELTRTFGL